MFNLTKNHDPSKNDKLISQFFHNSPSIKQIVQETNNLFAQYKKRYPFPSNKEAPRSFSISGLFQKATAFLLIFFCRRSALSRLFLQKR